MSRDFSILDRRLAALKETREDSLYYAITLTADEKLKVVFGTQTHFVGWADKERRVELRKARLVYPKFCQLWADLGLPYAVVHELDDLTLFLLAGGNALVEQSLAEKVLYHLLEASPSVPDGEVGFAHPDMFGPQAARRAPTPKLRMQVLVRDGRRCRICGRRPDDDTDLELHVHHIRPWSAGGITDISNLITLCHTCHNGLEPHHDRRLSGHLSADSTDESDSRSHLAEFLQSVANYRKAGGFFGGLKDS